jgi:hypothetical protein
VEAFMNQIARNQMRFYDLSYKLLGRVINVEFKVRPHPLLFSPNLESNFAPRPGIFFNYLRGSEIRFGLLTWFCGILPSEGRHR